MPDLADLQAQGISTDGLQVGIRARIETLVRQETTLTFPERIEAARSHGLVIRWIPPRAFKVQAAIIAF